jgi:hypothetical protein
MTMKLPPKIRNSAIAIAVASASTQWANGRHHRDCPVDGDAGQRKSCRGGHQVVRGRGRIVLEQTVPGDEGIAADYCATKAAC